MKIILCRYAIFLFIGMVPNTFFGYGITTWQCWASVILLLSGVWLHDIYPRKD